MRGRMRGVCRCTYGTYMQSAHAYHTHTHLCFLSHRRHSMNSVMDFYNACPSNSLNSSILVTHTHVFIIFIYIYRHLFRVYMTSTFQCTYFCILDQLPSAVCCTIQAETFLSANVSLRQYFLYLISLQFLCSLPFCILNTNFFVLSIQ